MLINFNCPVRSAILLYLLAVAILLVTKPDFLRPEYSAFFGPTAIFLAILVYFVMVALSICV